MFGIFLNFEKVSIDIIEQQISKMTDGNIIFYENQSMDELNEAKFTENLKHGSIAIAFLQNLFETSLNTILKRRADISETDLLKASITIKLQIIGLIYRFDLSEIKSNHSYEIYREVERIRNDIMHFKSNFLCESTAIPAGVTLDYGTSKKSLAEIFTQSFMKECYAQILNLIRLICSKCELYINEDVRILDCDGRDDVCEFIVSRDPANRD